MKQPNSLHRDKHELSVRERTHIEMAERRSKPHPASRPEINGSPALAALKANLRTARGPERARIRALIEFTTAHYRPPGMPYSPPPKLLREPSPAPDIDTDEQTPANDNAPALSCHAVQRPTATYDGLPCRKCGSTLKYVSTCGCVMCTRQRNREQKAARRRARAA